MGRVKRPYGCWSRLMLESLREAGVLKVEAFLEWLATREISIDRTLVSHWFAGRSHLPADLLPCLAEFTGRPELVFGPYLREVSCEVVHLPESAPSEKDLVHALLATGAALGHLQEVLLAARAPGSPGGEAVVAEERSHMRQHLEELIQQLSDLRARLARDECAAKPGGPAAA